MFLSTFFIPANRWNKSKRTNQPSATSPPFFDNLHFEHFDKHFKVDLWLTLLSKCSKWRLSKKGGLVADGWNKPIQPDADIEEWYPPEQNGDIIIYVFHAHFDRGLKVRLFWNATMALSVSSVVYTRCFKDSFCGM